MEMIKERTQEDPLKVFRKAVDNVKPALEVKSRRVGGSNYQVPIEVRPERRTALAHALADRLRARASREVDARASWPTSSWTPPPAAGAAFKKKEDTHRMAEANKAFAHYRW